jgi:hypothetical protein
MDVFAERPAQREMDRWLRGEDVGPEIDARCRAATEDLAYSPVPGDPAICTECDSQSGPEGLKDWTCELCLEAAESYERRREYILGLLAKSPPTSRQRSFFRQHGWNSGLRTMTPDICAMCEELDRQERERIIAAGRSAD